MLIVGGGILVVAAVLFVPKMASAAVTYRLPAGVTSDQNAIRAALRRASRSYGLNPEFLDVIGYVESKWRMQATNLVGPDGARGGAWGPTQITQTTARGIGYTGAMNDLLTNLSLVADLSAKILAQGKPSTLQDAVSWWNAGKRSFASLSSSHQTRVDYWPKAQKALQVVRSKQVVV